MKGLSVRVHMPEWEGKNVVVTGGAKGIGKCITQHFVEAGAHVFVVDIDQEALDAISNELSNKITTILCDVSKEEDCKKAASIVGAKGPIQALVNDAGIANNSYGNVFDCEMDEFDRIISTNLRGTFMMSKFCMKFMQEGSSIVNIASTRALMSEPNSEGYAASKGGIVALTHALSTSLGPKGIRVNSISPGWIDVSAWRPHGVQEEFRPVDHEQHPVGRVGVPSDIANMCLFLCSDKAGFITGQNHVIDGGMTIKMIYEE